MLVVPQVIVGILVIVTFVHFISLQHFFLSFVSNEYRKVFLHGLRDRHFER